MALIYDGAFLRRSANTLHSAIANYNHGKSQALGHL